MYKFNNKEILDLIALRDRIDDAIAYEDDDCPMDWNELELLFKVLENYLESLTRRTK